MNVEDFFESVYKYNLDLQRDVERVERMKSTIYAKTSQFQSVHSSSNQNSTENRYVNYLNEKDKLDKKTDILVNKKKKIKSMINILDDEILKDVLDRHYVKFQTWSKIAEDKHYSERQIYNFRRKALKKISLYFSMNL